MLSERLFSVREVDLNLAEGPQSGPTLVLLHGGSGRWQYAFDSIIPDLIKYWHVLAPDFRGHGKSGRVPGRYRLQDYAQDTIELLRSLPEPAIVFGHSMGAQVALLAAAEHPMRALVLGDTPFTIETLRTAVHNPIHRANLMEWRRLSGSPQHEILPVLEQAPIIGQNFTSRPAIEVFGKDSPWFAAMALNLAQLDPGTLDAVLEFEAMHSLFQPYQNFPQITCPVLILQGDPVFGGMLPDVEVAAALSRLPHALHFKFKGIGHALHNAQKDPVLKALLGFLDGV